MIKKLITKQPTFQNLNNCRRKILESSYFDFLLEPLIHRLEKYPPILVIDSTNLCNAKCSWCHNPDLKYPKGVMSNELFEKIIDDYSQYPGNVWFSTFGEPFMDKNILKKIKYLRKFSSIKIVNLLTNGLLLDSDKSRELLDLKIGIDISLDEVDKDNFERIKQIDFDRVIKNVFFLLEENKRVGNPVKVVVRIKTITNESEIEKSEVYHRLKELCNDIDLTPIMSTGSLANWAGSFNKKSFFDEFYPEINFNSRYKNYNLENNAPCAQLWKNIVVMWDGKVVLCCVDMEGEFIIGDLSKNTILEVWSGEKLNEIRELFKKRLKDKITICKKCDIHEGWQNLRKSFKPDGSLYKVTK